MSVILMIFLIAAFIAWRIYEEDKLWFVYIITMGVIWAAIIG